MCWCMIGEGFFAEPRALVSWWFRSYLAVPRETGIQYAVRTGNFVLDDRLWGREELCESLGDCPGERSPLPHGMRTETEGQSEAWRGGIAFSLRSRGWRSWAFSQFEVEEMRGRGRSTLTSDDR